MAMTVILFLPESLNGLRLKLVTVYTATEQCAIQLLALIWRIKV